jgi:hypothetical protein
MATVTNDIWVSNEEGQRKLDGAELEAFLADRETTRLEIEKRKADEEFVAAQRAVDRAELLNRLGITADEAALLLE